jgi:hypothetical protein
LWCKSHGGEMSKIGVVAAVVVVIFGILMFTLRRYMER